MLAPLLFASTLLVAQPSAAPAATDRIEADLGLGSALGYGGLSWTHAFTRIFASEVGVGYGVTGLQLSAMPRVFLGSGRHRFTAGAGLSLGLPARWSGVESRNAASTLWLNIDAAGYEYRSPSGLSFSTSVGITRGIAGEDTDLCATDFATCKTHALYPQWRMGVGYWF